MSHRFIRLAQIKFVSEDKMILKINRIYKEEYSNNLCKSL